MFAKPLTALAPVASMAAPALAGDALTAFDVAEDQTRFSFAPVFDDGMPAHGNPFMSQGYIYPAGTLAGGATGVLENGDPAWPKKVIGTRTCDGWFVGDAMHGTTGTILISRQVFQFDDCSILITQGREIADQDTPFHRAVAGGTGDYADADGAIEQTLLGFTEHMGAILTFTLSPDEGGGLRPSPCAVRPGRDRRPEMFPRPKDLLARIGRWRQARCYRRAAARGLRNASDHLLRDIGLTGYQADRMHLHRQRG